MPDLTAPEIEVRPLRPADGLGPALAVRRAVFVVEQGVPEAAEADGRDDACDHLLALAGGEAVGTLRTRDLGGGLVKIERVAVLAPWRRDGVGRALMLAALERLRAGGAKAVKLHAQTTVAGFYERLGFETVGAPFEEEGIPHVAMRRALAGGGAAPTPPPGA